MDNPSLILKALDGHLAQPARLVLYGRAALQLGFTDPPRESAESKDVDAIIPLGDAEQFAANETTGAGELVFQTAGETRLVANCNV